MARAIGAEAREIIFTSGATESNNLAIKGLAQTATRRGKHLVTVSAEHKAVLDPMKRLARQGWDVTIVDCDEFGGVSADAVAGALTDQTVLVSVMAANNEVGTINPIGEIGRLCHERGIVFHTDAAQAVGKVPLDVRREQVDLLSLSAHKIYGPKGIGALYVRRHDPQVRLQPLFDGGGHERGFRSGTLAGPADRGARDSRRDGGRPSSPRNRGGSSSCESGSIGGCRAGWRASGSMAIPPIACRAI